MSGLNRYAMVAAGKTHEEEETKLVLLSDRGPLRPSQDTAAVEAGRTAEGSLKLIRTNGGDEANVTGLPSVG